MVCPECNLGKNITYEEIFKNFVPNHIPFYQNPDLFTEEPFRIFGNLYYVGDKKVCMHLIDTGDGLILFDSGYGHTRHMLLDSIRKLGFAPEDIRYVIHSHGHFDHFGSGNFLRNEYGCKIYMSKVDTQLIREMPERALIHLGPIENDEMCWPDVELEDGDIIKLGNTAIRCILAPGHTFGTMAFFFDVTDGTTVHKVGYWGGIGFLTVYKAYCRDYSMPETKCQLMKETIQKLLKESVDITIGNHPAQNCTLEKRQWMLDHPGENPFINPNTWQYILSQVELRRQDFEALGY